MGILLFLTDAVAHLPKAVLGTTIASLAVGLVDIAAWRALVVVDRVELRLRRSLRLAWWCRSP